MTPNLRGLFGGLVRGYLPQVWAFSTEGETVALSVDREGNASVRSGDVSNPDVLIQTSHAILAHILRTRSRVGVPPGPLRATPVTPKGDAAFRYLRGRFGL